MSKYEERLAADKRSIREQLSKLGRRVEAAVAASAEAVLTGEQEVCYQIILGDLAINRELRAVDKQCHAFVARHLPSAGHLRFVSSALKMIVELERVGDYAATIAREAVFLREPPPEPFASHLRDCAEQACATLNQAVTAFSDSNAKLARASKPKPRHRGGTFDQAFRELVAKKDTLALQDLLALKTVFYKLERVSDQGKNICEETLFELLGEVKPRKQYRVLFVSARDTLTSPLAVAIACKAFPKSGEYSSAGWNAGEELAAEAEDIAQTLGLDLSDNKPTQLPGVEDLGRYHVIVSLCVDARRHIPEIPRKAIYLEWDLPKLSGVSNGDLMDCLREITQHLSTEVRELMVALQGEGAD